MTPANQPLAQLPRILRDGRDLEKSLEAKLVHKTFTSEANPHHRHVRLINKTNSKPPVDKGVKRSIWTRLAAQPNGESLQSIPNGGERVVDNTCLTTANLARLGVEVEDPADARTRDFADVLKRGFASIEDDDESVHLSDNDVLSRPRMPFSGCMEERIRGFLMDDE